MLVILLSFVLASDVGATETWRKLGNTPGFPGLNSALKQIVRDSGRKSGNICAVLWDQHPDRMLYTLWQQEHLLYE